MNRITIALAGTALLLSAAAGAQQDGTTTQVGPPELRDFSLPGTTTRPATPQPDQAPAARPPASQTPPAQQPAARPPAARPPASQTPRPAPPASPPAAEREQPRATPAQPGAAAPAPTPAPAIPQDLPDALDEPLANVVAPPEMPEAQVPLPTQPPPEASAEETSTEPEEINWGLLSLLVSAGILLLCAAAWFLRRRRARAEEAEEEAYAAAAPENVPGADTEADRALVPAAAAPAAKPQAEPRPWIELEVRPERASLTDRHAAVSFWFAIRNAGDAPARNLRIWVRMFNASPGQRNAIEAFFTEAAQNTGVPSSISIPAGEALEFKSEVTLPRAEVQEIRMQDRVLFVPVLAFNVWYEWEKGKTGQTSKTFVVGTESQPPAEKMGPFRLDLGPRIYRSVGQRQHDLDLVV